VTTTKDAIVYCDESGNSGPNYLHPDQPFYGLGGWVVPTTAIAEACLVVEHARIKVCPQRNELKSESFLAGEWQKRGALDLFQRLGALGAVPLYLTAEKRFCVAAKIVETFLDPAYNTSLAMAFTGDVITKQEIANTFYDRLPSEVVGRFAAAYRKPTEEAFSNSLEEIVEAVRRYINPELAKVLDASRKQLGALAEAEAEDSVFGKVSATLNMPCLASFFMMVENLGRLGFVNPVRFVHDEQRAYGLGYEKVFQTHKTIHDWFVRLPHTEIAFAALNHITQFDMVKSQLEPLVQAADVLAGTVNHLCTLAARDCEITAADAALADAIFPALLVSRPQVAWPIWSDQLTRRVGKTSFRRILENLPKSEASKTVPSIAELDEYEHAALLPALKDDRADESRKPRYPFELPVYGIVNTLTNELLVLRNSHESGETVDSLNSVIPLFNRRRDAEAFYTSVRDSIAANYQLCEFGPKTVPDLIGLLEKGLRQTATIVYDAATDRQAHVALSPFLKGLKSSFDRVVRTFTSGLHDSIYQFHEVKGVEIISMLSSDGDYVAGSKDGGKVFKGKTRQAAIDAFVASGSFLKFDFRTFSAVAMTDLQFQNKRSLPHNAGCE
jgi:hypothetical protein